MERVSIHAPAWGATRRTGFRCCAAPVSIHAPAWGATTAPQCGHSVVLGFNPRARVGRDRGRASGLAPIFSFNPRARVGRDPHALLPCSSQSMFQSTRPRGARLSPSWTNTNYSTKQSYIQVTTRLTKITRPAVPQFRCQGTRANIPANRHHLPFARHRARQLAEPQGHKVSLHQNAQPFFANSSRGYTRAGYLLTHQ